MRADRRTDAAVEVAGAESEGLNPQEAARYIGIDRSTFYATGLVDQVPHLRVGRRRIYPRSLLREWMCATARRA